VSLTLLSVPALVLALLLTTVGGLTPLPPFLIMTLALALPAAALLERAQARALQEVLPDTALRAARARGVPRLVVTWRHAWPLSLPAVLGLASIIGSQLLSGALAIELVTARTGLGLLTYEALLARDPDLAAGCAAAAALLVGLVTLTSDALHLWLDPRARDAAGPRRAPPGFGLPGR
jgi:peptide/nickel transport system permease protein